MSASERLAALMSRTRTEHRLNYGRVAALNELDDALLEIIAVVEAAEAVTFYGQEAYVDNEWHGSRLIRALAALDEKLGESGPVDTNEKARRLGYDSLDAYLQDLYDGDGLDEQLGGGK